VSIMGPSVYIRIYICLVFHYINSSVGMRYRVTEVHGTTLLKLKIEPEQEKKHPKATNHVSTLPKEKLCFCCGCFLLCGLYPTTKNPHNISSDVQN